VAPIPDEPRARLDDLPVPDERLKAIRSGLTVVRGQVVHTADPQQSITAYAAASGSGRHPPFVRSRGGDR
jgi:hypothetical protein